MLTGTVVPTETGGTTLLRHICITIVKLSVLAFFEVAKT